MPSEPHFSVYDGVLDTDELADLAGMLDRDTDNLNVKTVVWTDGVRVPLLFCTDGSVSDATAQIAADDTPGGKGDMKIYDRELSPAELRSIYNNATFGGDDDSDTDD